MKDFKLLWQKFFNFHNHGLWTHDGLIPNSLSPNSNCKYLGFGYKRLVFVTNNGILMENMDKGLNVPKRVLIVRPKISQMPQNISAQFICLKVLDFSKKRLFWASVVCGSEEAGFSIARYDDGTTNRNHMSCALRSNLNATTQANRLKSIGLLFEAPFFIHTTATFIRACLPFLCRLSSNN